MSEDNQLLIVAWDGLDHNLIDKFDLKHIPLETMGLIDNDMGINTRSTSELYTSFITGETWREHGVTGINKFNRRGEVLEKAFPKNIRGLLPGLDLIYNKLWDLSGADKRKYEKHDYNVDTLFDVVDNSRAMFVPGYNPGFGWSANLKSHTLDELMYRDEPLKEGEKTVDMMFNRRWNKFQQAFDEDDYSLLMVHFHFPDYIQHFYGARGISYDEDRLREMYERVDAKAKQVKQWADLYGYDLLFISDHGLPENMEHNKEAFYSIQGDFDVVDSKEIVEGHGLENDGIPITMFYGEILEYLGLEAEAVIHNN